MVKYYWCQKTLSQIELLTDAWAGRQVFEDLEGVGLGVGELGGVVVLVLQHDSEEAQRLVVLGLSVVTRYQHQLRPDRNKQELIIILSQGHLYPLDTGRP